MSRRQNTSPTTSRRAFTLNDFCDAYSIGRSSAYGLIRKGKLRSVRVGGRRLIPADAAEKLLRSEEAAS
jgi:excisionase family DNA binding protein